MVRMVSLVRHRVINICHHGHGVLCNHIRRNVISLNIRKFGRFVSRFHRNGLIRITVGSAENEHLLCIGNGTVPDQNIGHTAAVDRSTLEPERHIAVVHDIVFHQHVADSSSRMASRRNGSAMALPQEIIEGPDIGRRLLSGILNAFPHTGCKVDSIVSRIDKVIEDHNVLRISNLDSIGVVDVIGGELHVAARHVLAV